LFFTRTALFNNFICHTRTDSTPGILLQIGVDVEVFPLYGTERSDCGYFNTLSLGCKSHEVGKKHYGNAVNFPRVHFSHPVPQLYSINNIAAKML